MITRIPRYDLSSRNTFRMKVSCGEWLEFSQAGDLVQIDFSSLLQPVMIMGGGSNLLFTKDFEGTILHSRIEYINEIYRDENVVRVDVGSGVVFDDFCLWAVERELWGPENLSYIPGEVGASAVQNVGAYGVEAGDIISLVHCFDMQEGKFVEFTKEECDFAYRDSFFKKNKGRYVVTSVEYELSVKQKAMLEYGPLRAIFGAVEEVKPSDVRRAVVAIRKEKLPDIQELGSAGSFFKNPVVPLAVLERIESEYENVPSFDVGDGMVKIPAAWLIEKCGFKAKVKGGAAVYAKQPLVIVNNSGNASADEILSLEKDIISSVKSIFGIVLQAEVEHI